MLSLCHFTGGSKLPLDFSDIIQYSQIQAIPLVERVHAVYVWKVGYSIDYRMRSIEKHLPLLKLMPITMNTNSDLLEFVVLNSCCAGETTLQNSTLTIKRSPMYFPAAWENECIQESADQRY
ncbi:hypothetical protein EYC80_004318 [Monilinia laxa]|uniref:Uncharacterized protein n=1 Tax=Monilinia laxa TaxID=61186 RepID=A0A5N6KMH6_MONLA|nr:hypothetical protein EYC80_004318 [Monilinia laxa]